MDFQFYMPTRVISGRDCLEKGGALFKDLGSKAFIMTGASSAEKNGSLADTCLALKSAGIAWEHFNRVEPNPTLERVREASLLAREAGADFIVAIGGGSAIDAAKAVAVLAAGDLTDEELLARRSFDSVLPIAAVPTTAGTGSEVTQYSILTNNKLQTKSFLVSPEIFPALSFLDGKYMDTLPPFITAATAIDAISHSIEGYLAVRATPVARSFALDSLRAMASPFKKIARGTDLTSEDRDALLYASMLGGIVIAQSGTTAVHVIGYSLTYFKGIDHGKANGLLMGAYFDYLYKERKEDVDTVLSALGMESREEFDRIVRSLMGPEVLTQDEIEKFAGIAINGGNIANTRPRPDIDDIKAILTASLT